MQFSCRMFLPRVVAIVVANQKRDDVLLRNRSYDLLNTEWLSQIRTPDELRRAE